MVGQFLLFTFDGSLENPFPDVFGMKPVFTFHLPTLHFFHAGKLGRLFGLG
jgi:hypothetical protein